MAFIIGRPAEERKLTSAEIYDLLKSGPIEESRMAKKLDVDQLRLSRFLMKMLKIPGQKIRHKWNPRREHGHDRLDSIYFTEEE